MLRDYMLPGGSLEWSHFQCPVCKQNFTGYTAFTDHTGAGKCKPAKDKTVNNNAASLKEIN
jgi:hypothetical protein